MVTCGLRAAWLLAALILPGTRLLAAQLEAVTVTQSAPGTVVVTVRSPDAAPAASSFHLDLTSDGAQARLPARSVEPVADLADDLKTSVVILIDRSGSMQHVTPAVKQALADVLAAPRPDLRIAIMSFGSDIKPLSPFASDAGALLRAVDGIRAEVGRDGRTKLFDAIAAASVRLQNDPSHGPKRLVVISDGKDEGSLVSRESASKIVHDGGGPLDAIAFGDLAPRWSGSLASLAGVSGGKYVLAESGGGLSEALRSDLGTRPSPAFNVSFGYTPRDATSHADSAALEYEAPGSLLTRIALSQAIAAPAPATLPGAFSKPSEAPMKSTPAPEDGTAAWLNRTFAFGSLVLTMKGLLAGLIVLLAGLAALFFSLWRRGDRTPPPVNAPPAPPSEPMQKRPPVHEPTQVRGVFAAPAPGRPIAMLLNTDARGATTHFAIEKATIEIGADAHNDLVIRGDNFVSRRHASIRYESGTLYLDDLGSSNGTFRNEVRLHHKPMSLSAGDVVRFGHTRFELHAVDHARAHPKESPGALIHERNERNERDERRERRERDDRRDARHEPKVP